jgi:perosamine synthetase
LKNIPLTKPYITQEVKDKVCEVLDSGYLTEGAVTKEFEDVFKSYVGCRYALAVTSGTVGLELALRIIGVGPGDEVIVPDYTYPATADVVAIVGATVVIVDVNKDTMLINYDALEDAISSRTKSIVPVSLFGNPLDYNRLNAIKKRHKVYIIEDAACSIGAEYHNTRTGGLADISVFSLHPRKFITTGEGGMITTENPLWNDLMCSYKHFGIVNNDSRLTASFDRIGTNCKLSDILAAVGLVQMFHIDELLSQRRFLAQHYIELLRDHQQVKIPSVTIAGKHSYQSFCIFINNRNEVMEALREQGIEVQIGTYSLHMQKAFAENPQCRIMGDMEGSRYAFEQCLTLPLYHELTSDDQEYIVEKLIQAIDDT